MKIEFTDDEVSYTYLTMLTSIGFSGYDKFLSRVDLPEEEIKSIIESLYQTQGDVFKSMSDDILQKVVIIFGQSCLQIGPLEMGIIVGISWIEIMMIYEKLRNYCYSERKIAVF